MDISALRPIEGTNMFIGVDAGGTTIKVTAFASRSDTEGLQHLQLPVSAEKDFGTDSNGLKRCCNELANTYGDIEGIGVAIAGRMNKERTGLVNGPNLPHWNNRRIGESLARRYGCRVVLGNDAEASAMAEGLYGHGQGIDFWGIIWGTGIGGALVRQIGGKPYTFPGEPGHISLNQSVVRRCNCGQSSCLEAYCGGASIQKQFKVDAERLNGDQKRLILYRMANGLRNLVVSQPVDRMIFSGGIGANQPEWLDTLEALLERDLRIVDPPRLIISKFGEKAGTLGAMALLDLALPDTVSPN